MCFLPTKTLIEKCFITKKTIFASDYYKTKSMKTKKLFGILSLLIIIGVTSCNSDTPQDNVENIKMKVSSEIGTYQPWGSDHFIDCMLVKEEGKNEYEALDFLGIAGFDYSKGYEYTLLVKKTTLLNPPADASNIAYELVEVLSKVGVEYEYTIEVDGPNPFILSPDGGKYEIPFACKRKKYVAGEFTEEEYAPLKGLRYNMGTNYGTYTSIIKDGDTVGLYKFVIEGIEPYNMEGTPWWYYGIYPADADFFSETEPEPIYKQLFEQPQTEGEEHFIYPIIYASSGTFD